MILVLVLVWFLGVPALALSRSRTVDDTPSGSRPAPQPGTAILLVGSDSREGLTAEERAKYGVGNAQGNRTDTMLILYIPPSGAAALISLPRDSYVAIPGHGKNKLNAAYSFGGAPLLVQTVEQVTGVRIDGYLSIGMGGLAKMVDAVHGVDVCLDKPMKDASSGANFPAGCQTLDGAEALSYVRQRKADPRGDLGRVERQREVIAKVARKVLTPGTLLNPFAYWSVCMAAGEAISRGTDTDMSVLMSALKGFAQLGSGKGLTGTVPISNPGANTPAGSSVIWNDAEATKMFGLIASGTTAGLDKYLKK